MLAGVLSLSLTTSLLAQSKCYTEAEVAKIASAITSLTKCENELFLRKTFIDETITAQEPPKQTAWWQEPSVIAGGLVISFSTGLLVSLLIAKK